MYHNYVLFNSEHLFFGFNGLRLSKIKDNEKALELNNYFEEFLYKADRLYYLLYKMNKIAELIKNQAIKLRNTSIKEHKVNPECPEIIFPENVLLHYNTIHVNEFLGYVSPFLNTLFVLQDRILVIIGKFLDISEDIPLKLPGFYDFRNQRWKTILDQYGANIKHEVSFYWANHAREIRKYRNLDQHQINLLQLYGLDKDGNFHLFLPNEPDSITKYDDITYSKKIDALNLFNSEFSSFHDFVENLMKQLGINEKKHELEVRTNQSVKDFREGECMSIFQNGKQAICFYCGEKDKTGAAKLKINQLPLKNNKLVITIR